MFFEFCLGLRTAVFLFSIRRIASNTVHRDILSLGLLQSLWLEQVLRKEWQVPSFINLQFFHETESSFF